MKTKGNEKKLTRGAKIALIIAAALIVLALAMGATALVKWKTGGKLRAGMFVSAATPAVITLEREGAAEAATPTPDASPEATPDATPETALKPGTVKYEGKYYFPKEGVFSVLFMGVDSSTEMQYKNIGLNANQADTLILAVVDSKNNRLDMINVPRNTITDVKQLDSSFNYARTTRSPICIQHAFGDGGKLSAELTRDAIASLLFGVDITRYIAMTLDGIYVANDMVGGVTLTLEDDFSFYKSAMKKGAEYTLNGRDAEEYIRDRQSGTLDGTSMSRLRRQVQYYKAFFKTAKAKLRQDPAFALSLYANMERNLTTDLTADEIIYLAKTVITMDMTDECIHTLAGENDGEDFYADDNALKALIIEVFYEEVND